MRRAEAIASMGEEGTGAWGWPQNSKKRLRQSPRMVDRRCPTCISFAMFGDEKSAPGVRGAEGIIKIMFLLRQEPSVHTFEKNTQPWWPSGSI